MKTLYFESGEVVFEAGSLSDYAYLIEEGKFEVSRLQGRLDQNNNK